MNQPNNASLEDLDDRVIGAIKTCYDPEIPVNIHELGLIYQVRVTREGAVTVLMTLTAPNCPAAQSLPAEVREKILSLPGVSAADVQVVWDPPWTPERMSEAARLELGFL
jgi:FeS assembly SUF system protein